MALECTFLFEINLEDVKNFTNKDIVIKSRFGEVFKLNLKQPDDIKKFSSSKARRYRQRRRRIHSERSQSTIQSGHSVLCASTLDGLLMNMLENPLEISVWQKKTFSELMGSICIPWSQKYIDYLQALHTDMKTVPVFDCGEYNITNQTNTKTLARLKIKVNLSLMTSGYIPEIKKVDSTDTSNSDKHDFKLNQNESLTRSLIKLDITKEKFKNGNAVLCFSDIAICKKRQGEIIRTTSVLDLHKKQNINLHDFLNWENFTRVPDLSYCVGFAAVGVKDSTSNSSDQGKNVKKTPCGNSKCQSTTTEYPTCGKPTKMAETPCFSKCLELPCETKGTLPPKDDRILLDLSHYGKPCCTQEISGTMRVNLTTGKIPCDCACECTFGFTKKTTFCGICGGFEEPGTDTADRSFPCPVFHKLVDEKRLKTFSPEDGDRQLTKKVSEKRSRSTVHSAESEINASTLKQNINDTTSPKKKSKKKKVNIKDERFIFNYGYTAPRIGHDMCAAPCYGTMGMVPKHMGWLWNAKNLPGMKFRPGWRPGAIAKHVERLLKSVARSSSDAGKKKKNLGAKKKFELQKPLLTIHKKNGEYNILMESIKTYPKPRAINQYPYDENPMKYIIGRTEEENVLRRKKKERRQRRLEREQREYLQRTFKDMCKEICLKTYKQAVGILKDAEDPHCQCFLPNPEFDKLRIDDHSCSCSEDENLSDLESESDNDEWVLEFTPPTAKYDPYSTYKPRVTSDMESQYNYLDYRVKCLDRSGSQVPRFFRGPGGTTQCSDLGGFWGPDKTWLDINVDGFIAADKRWAPMLFIGPGGERVEATNEKFVTSTGEKYQVGVDGFVDDKGIWRFYPRKNAGNVKQQQKKSSKCTRCKPRSASNGQSRDTSPKMNVVKKTSRCFGDTPLIVLTSQGITGHGHDKRLLQSEAKSSGPSRRQKSEIKATRVLKTNQQSTKKLRIASKIDAFDSKTYFEDRYKCHHAVPSDKGILASDGRHKMYFKIKTPNKNKRFQDRINALKEQGISVSAAHVPCLHSFINSVTLQDSLRKRLNIGHLQQYEEQVEKEIA